MLRGARRTKQGVLRSSLALGLGLALVSASTADAALREYRVEFLPSASAVAAGYTLHIGTQTGSYATEFDLGNPPPAGATVIYGVDFEDSVDLFVALRTYDGAGLPSEYSNEIRVTAVVPDPPVQPPAPPEEAPDTGGGDPDPTPDSPAPSDPAPAPDPPQSDGGGDDDPVNDGDPTSDPAPEDDGDPHFNQFVGLMTTSAGTIDRVASDGQAISLTHDSFARTKDLRPARCDLDGDGDQDLVIGFGEQSGSTLAVFILEDERIEYTHAVVAGNHQYREEGGMTYPACGDIDGDGLAEIVVGFGPRMEGMIQILDDVTTNFEPMESSKLKSDGWLQVVTRGNENVPLFPAVGDIDGDSLAEIVIGSGDGSRMGIVILDDYVAGLVPHPSVESRRGTIKPMPATAFSRTRNVMRRPALGDVDGDGLDEIVVSFGKGSGGQIMILDDARAGYTREGSPANTTITAGRADYQRLDGETCVGLGDMDHDGRAEIVVGFTGTDRDELQVFEDVFVGSAPIGGVGRFVAAGGRDVALVPSPAD